MPGSINGAVRQDIQSIYARGMDSSACATERPAFINLITEGRNDPIALFRQQPHQTVNAKNLVLHEVQKNLPADFLQKELSPEGNKIRMLIGVIYKDVQDSGNPEDLAKLDKVCKKFAEANGNENKEQKVAKELSDLVSRYSKGAFEKVINKYIEHCMEAWEDYHQAKSVDTEKKVIFRQCLDVCKATLEHDLKGLAQPDQPWETMAQKLNFFVNDCAAISKTMTFYDKKPVTPAPQGPETLNPNPDGGADNQRVFIPTGPGQGGTTLNITSQGGSVGDITHSVGAANTAPADSKSQIVKHILDSGLTNAEKVGLIKDLFNANTGDGSNFLENLAGVQGYKQEQAVDTPQLNVAWREIETRAPKPELHSISTQTEGAPETETVIDASINSEVKLQQPPAIDVEQNKLKTAFDGGASQTQDLQNLEADNLDGGILREKKEASSRTSLSSDDFIYTISSNDDLIDTTSSRNIAPLNRGSSVTEIKPEQVNGKDVTQADKFETGKTTAFVHADKNGAVISEGDKAKPTAGHDVENNLSDSLIRPQPDSSLNPHVRKEGSAADSVPVNSKMANPDTDSTEGRVVPDRSEQVSSGQVTPNFGAGNLQPIRKNAGTFYSTVRTVSLWNRNTKPSDNFVPFGPDELSAVFARLKPRHQTEFDALENKSIERDKEKLPFQERLAELSSPRGREVTGHE